MIPITSAETLVKALCRYRKDLGLSQSDAGKKFNLPQKTVSRIESGIATMQLDTLFKYISALGLEIQLGPRNKLPEESLW